MGYSHRFVFGKKCGYTTHPETGEEVQLVFATVDINAHREADFPPNDGIKCAIQFLYSDGPKFDDIFGDDFIVTTLDHIYTWAKAKAAETCENTYYRVMMDTAKIYLESERPENYLVVHLGW